MGTTYLGDIPSGALPGPANISHASAATDAASAMMANIGVAVQRAAQDITIVNAYHEPTGADQPAQDAASYRLYYLMDGSADGLGTRILASGSYTASQASNTRKSLTLIDSPTVGAGHVIYAKYGATVGGTHAGTVVRAGIFSYNFRPI